MARSQTLASARALLLLQVGVRLVTFALNQLLVRTTSPAVFGAANVQLELVLSIVLALARDGVRATVMRRRDKLNSVHNLALLPVATGSVLAGGVGWVYVRYLAPEALLAQGSALHVSVALYCLGAVLELLSEPLHTHALALSGYVRVRVAMEASAVLVRAALAVALLHPAGLAWLAQMYTHFDAASLPVEAYALVAFSLSRAAYGAVFFGTAWMGVACTDSWRTAFRTLCPVRDAPLDAETRNLVFVASGQALLKFVLTEGDKLAVARLTTLEDQGGYALASNYGSLLARTVFQPVEESARLYFSDTLGDKAPHETRAKQTYERSATLLRVLFRLHALLGLGLLTFGPPLAQPFLMLVAGPRWASPPSHAPAILASYCCYLPVMGINGIVEAFLQSTAPPTTLAWYSRVLIGSSATFALALFLGHIAFPALGFGCETVLVWANTLGLAVRAIVCLRYISATFARASAGTPRLHTSLPSQPVLGALSASAVALRWQAQPLGPRGTWLAPGAPLPALAATTAAGVGTVLVLWYVF